MVTGGCAFVKTQNFHVKGVTRTMKRQALASAAGGAAPILPQGAAPVSRHRDSPLPRRQQRLFQRQKVMGAAFPCQR